MPARTTPGLTFTRHDGDAAREIVDELNAVYAEVYGVPPYAGDPFFSVETFADRLTAAFTMRGFEVVTARLDDGALVGYVHGVTLTPDRAWWASIADDLPADAKQAAEAGDVFWLRELMVLPKATNLGIGRRLHDVMVDGRPEPWTTLTCIVDNEPARSAYPRWGYEVVAARIKHAPESPVYDPMLLRPGRLG
ncbi:GNAT family N-acetyltransferase [Streptomyces cyaneofuscatus]|uniref:GNAT family N-acetyltransferase n=1 Tax=Streptomyces cyaneofuscatus TaxID=66883 RepID=UPI0013D9907C|nr:GNAT family N-acetyltransferase [Streptomyces cyaneofuscatus]NDZ67815.1 GNAT family N-acetyltransferase [Streptomyces cyaneofuscatus]